MRSEAVLVLMRVFVLARLVALTLSIWTCPVGTRKCATIKIDADRANVQAGTSSLQICMGMRNRFLNNFFLNFEECTFGATQLYTTGITATIYQAVGIGAALSPLGAPKGGTWVRSVIQPGTVQSR